MNLIMPFDKIGSVKILKCSSSSTKDKNYSDGESEDVLLDLFKSSQEIINKERKKLLQSSWPYFYHLSEHRGNVINWYDFKPKSKVLEIGAGCGAITESLVQKDIDVTALELTEKRCLINAHRNKDAKNLSVVIGNVQDFAEQSSETYDYIVCIGVLEYSGTFIEGSDPYLEFLELLKSLLSPDGKLILAIENRIGLKYWSGSKEDHDNNELFDGINLYPNSNGVETFGRLELNKLLKKSGFKDNKYYYPYPDYKFPRLLFSDGFYPGDGMCEFPLSQLPAPALDRDRVELFSEGLAMISIEKNNLFRDFSNSFVVISSPNKTDEPNVVFSTFSSSRKDKYNITTKIRMSQNKDFVVEKSANIDSFNHLNRINDTALKLKSKKNLSQKFIFPSQVNLADKNSSEIYFPFIKGKNLERKLIELILENRQEDVINILDVYINKISKLSDTNKPSLKDMSEFKSIFGMNYPSGFSEYVNPGNIDLNFDNIIIDKSEEWYFYDYEWVFNFPIPSDLVVSRALWWFFGLRYGKLLGWHANKLRLINIGTLLVVPDYIHLRYKGYFDNLGIVIDIEEKLQQLVSSYSTQFPSIWKNKKIRAFSQTAGYIKNLDLDLEHKNIELGVLNLKNVDLEQKINILEKELSMILNSRGYRALEKARKIKRSVKGQ